MKKIDLDQAKKAVLIVLDGSGSGQVRELVNNSVRVYFKETQNYIPDNSDEITQIAIDSLLLEGKLKILKHVHLPDTVIRAEYLSE